MKRILTLSVFLLGVISATAQGPRMRVARGEEPGKFLELDQVEMSVHLLGEVAETVCTLRFHNAGPRDVEGELVMPLPAGATVSSYALEVNGKLREGVAVEKARARLAYETIKRQMIDPGIVEREAGNTYRTKVYPIPARSSKLVRIGYVEYLRPTATGFTYQLPLEYPEKLPRFSCSIQDATSDGLRIVDAAGLTFSVARDGRRTATVENAKLAGRLELSLPPLAQPEILIEEGSPPAFYLCARLPEVAPQARPAPNEILLCWDASESGLDRDHAKEFALLNSWFAQLRQTKVKLRLLRDHPEEVGEFVIQDGKWDKLRQALEQVIYDGATSFAGLTTYESTCDLALLVSDGVATLGGGIGLLDKPLIVIHAGDAKPNPDLAAAAERSGGTLIDLDQDAPAVALGKLRAESLRIIKVDGANPNECHWDFPLQPGTPVRIHGRLLERGGEALEICYGYGSKDVVRQKVRVHDQRLAPGLVSRLWAQRHLLTLERQPAPPREIIDHCKRYGLVSDFTSLIVLERMEDYVRYEIEPPEPELKVAYQTARREQSPTPTTNRGGSWREVWKDRLAWHQRDFPWQEVALFPRLKQVTIWQHALDKLFTKDQLDTVAVDAIRAWRTAVLAVIERRPKLRNPAEFAEWTQRITQLDAQGHTLAATPLHPPAAGQPLVVSVRGLAMKPGIITGDPGMTLRQAIAKAGGPHRFGSLAEVALYRNAGKTVHNTLSERYQDLRLFPGDMIVVEQHPSSDSDAFADSFAAGASQTPSADQRKEAPIREQLDVWINSSLDGLRTDWRSDAFGGNAGEDAATAIPRASARATDLTPDLTEFSARLAAGGSHPLAAYLKLKGNHRYAADFYIGVARLLTASRDPAAARRVLSNLIEQSPDNPAAIRACAYWLAEFGQFTAAEDCLTLIPAWATEDFPITLDLASIRAAKGDLQGAIAALEEFMTAQRPPRHPRQAAIARTDLNGLLAREAANAAGRAARHEGEIDPFAAVQPSDLTNLDADIRLVLYGNQAEAMPTLMVTEPTAHFCAYFLNSPSGGHITTAPGVAEYMIRRAVPGLYRVTCTPAGPTTIRAILYTNWGRKNQTTKTITLLLDGKQPVEITSFGHAFSTP
ncbi:MAG: VIT domain-containing protein [Verrucomicrobia bacterium]|nr:VIT domain-containing protein [Verrucomicrobiota bacterium]